MQERDAGRGQTPAPLTVVGLGPGDTALLAPHAAQAIETADVIVGYKTYLELIPQELLAGKTVIGTAMMQEMARCQQAIDQAMGGRSTVMVSSGDAGIYGMSGLVLELAEKQGLLDVMPFEVIPGIPALAAAAALLGAPLMHDFAVISLSDLLTPWDLIEKRLHHAALADFVLAIYNPRSKKRNWQLEKALNIVAESRDAKTPVGLVRQAYREEQAVSVHTLADFPVEQADMLSILIVGNSQTRPAGKWMLTPRGYMKKYGEK